MNSKLVIAVTFVLLVSLSGVAAAHPGLGIYKDIERAEADGYVQISPCVPGMGYHYGKVAEIDGDVNTASPEVLVYAYKDGELTLVAVEYIATEEFRLFGKHAHPFDVIPGTYAIHSWLFLSNPDGLTTDFNPRVDANCNVV
ncbi:hypothetical protein [Haladaptatus sp. DJG-WS-42]|uniref:hypothetical protein n=1 Tax=Haladaptatus sp. DJG-WS-42 TaxID=3120516 RepID=UPI0030CCD73A